MPSRTVSDGAGLERLPDDECWQLLESHCFGRVSFSVDDTVKVVLTAYVVRGGTLYFRAAAFGPVARQVRTRPVTLQVDDMTGDRQAAWSVTVTGLAHVVDDAATVASLWSPVRPASWETGQRTLWVALASDQVRGLRLRTTPGPTPQGA